MFCTTDHYSLLAWGLVWFLIFSMPLAMWLGAWLGRHPLGPWIYRKLGIETLQEKIDHGEFEEEECD